MQHITGISRHQMRFSSLEDTISLDNQVRFIDAFVEYIDLSKLDFAIKTLKTEGRPSFNSKVFLKMYLYGYLNGVRSGRDLEKECLRNMEMQWLLEDIRPNYHSITDFRKDNPIALKKLFKLFVSFLKDADLIGGETIAIDGTKSRAHNSKKANFNQKKIDKHLAYIEAKTQEYLNALEENDGKENSAIIQNIQQKIEPIKYEQIRQELWRKPWVVFAKKPFGSPKSVVEYLGRYTHKIAISNHRIKSIDNKNVTFDYKDYRMAGVKKQMTLTHQEFIRRFSLHILPKRFVKIRHYGFLSSTRKRQKLKLLQEKLKVKVLEKAEKKPFLPKCPCCILRGGQAGNLHRIAVFDQRGPPAWYLGGSQSSSSCPDN